MRYWKSYRMRLLPGLLVLVLLSACGGTPTAPEAAATVSPTATATIASSASSASTDQFNPDSEADSINFDQLDTLLGPVPEISRSYQVGVVLKFLGNQYWELLAAGMRDQADGYGITLDVRAAESEADQFGQLVRMDAMLEEGYDAILISPQTDTNLLPAVERAEAADVLVLNVNDAVLPDAQHWVGPNQYENGVRVARYLIETLPDGGQVAVIEGQAGVYAARQRTQGFRDTLQDTPFQVVAGIPADWDAQQAADAATAILEQYPELKAFYCNNDIMALGVVDALKATGRLDTVMVFGTDGIDAAYASIRNGELTGTVDSFPFVTGQAAVEVLVRLLEDQPVPRAVYSPQNLITAANVDNPHQPVVQE